MERVLTASRPYTGLILWILSASTVLLASLAVITIILEPRAFPIALGAGLLSLLARSLFARARAATRSRAEAASAVANAGLALAALAVAPLIAFALLWTAMLLIIAVAWLLHLVHLV